MTTEVTGNCGMSGAPFEGPVKERGPYAAYGFTPFWDSVPTFLLALAKQPKPVNIAPLVGHGTLRCAVMGMADRAPSTIESDRLGRMLSEGLQAGAFGLSTGLYFAPGAYAQKDEPRRFRKNRSGARNLICKPHPGRREPIRRFYPGRQRNNRDRQRRRGPDSDFAPQVLRPRCLAHGRRGSGHD